MTCQTCFTLTEVGILAALRVRHSSVRHASPNLPTSAFRPYRLPSIRHSRIRHYGPAFGIPFFGIPDCADIVTPALSSLRETLVFCILHVATPTSSGFIRFYRHTFGCIIAVLQEEFAQQASTQDWTKSTVSDDRKTAPAARDSLDFMIECCFLTATKHLLPGFDGLRSFFCSISINFSGSSSKTDSCGSSRICCISLSSTVVSLEQIVNA